MNFIFFLLPLFCSASLLPDLKNVSNINGTALISSLTDANPDDVMEVRRLIDELIAAGETDRDTATTARDGAQDAYNAAGTALGEATDAHTHTAGELVGAEEEEARLTTLEDEKRVAKEAAQAAKDAATGELTAAEDHLASETTRLDSEKATLERILVLLDTLLGVPEVDFGGNCAKIFEHVNYEGKEIDIPVGEYSWIENIQGAQGFNDKTSSVRVAPGCTMIAYLHGSFGDPHHVLTGDHPGPHEANWNDQFSSFKCSC